MHNLQVRTRAVTIQKYISSRDDILKHAVKLLKAELPISLRLIGGFYQWVLCYYIVMGQEKMDSYSSYHEKIQVCFVLD